MHAFCVPLFGIGLMNVKSGHFSSWYCIVPIRNQQQDKPGSYRKKGSVSIMLVGHEETALEAPGDRMQAIIIVMVVKQYH